MYMDAVYYANTSYTYSRSIEERYQDRIEENREDIDRIEREIERPREEPHKGRLVDEYA